MCDLGIRELNHRKSGYEGASSATIDRRIVCENGLQQRNDPVLRTYRNPSQTTVQRGRTSPVRSGCRPTAGFSLDQVRELLHFVDGGDYTCDEVRSMAVGHMASVKRKIADLNKMKGVLSEMVNQCDGGQVPDCPIIDALFESTLR